MSSHDAATRPAHTVLGLENLMGRIRRGSVQCGSYSDGIPVLTRTRPQTHRCDRPATGGHQPMCRRILVCFETQLDEVFKSLADDGRRGALRLFKQEIAARYDNPPYPRRYVASELSTLEPNEGTSPSSLCI